MGMTILYVYSVVGLCLSVGAVFLGRRLDHRARTILYACALILPLWLPIAVYGWFAGEEEP